jgi:hypothetical protein
VFFFYLGGRAGRVAADEPGAAVRQGEDQGEPGEDQAQQAAAVPRRQHRRGSILLT